MVESLYHNRSRAPSKNTGFKRFPAAARPVGLLPYLIFRIVLRRQGFHFTNFLCWEACTWSGLCVFSKGLENGFHLGGRDQVVFFCYELKFWALKMWGPNETPSLVAFGLYFLAVVHRYVKCRPNVLINMYFIVKVRTLWKCSKAKHHPTHLHAFQSHSFLQKQMHLFFNTLIPFAVFRTWFNSDFLHFYVKTVVFVTQQQAKGIPSQSRLFSTQFHTAKETCRSL